MQVPKSGGGALKLPKPPPPPVSTPLDTLPPFYFEIIIKLLAWSFQPRGGRRHASRPQERVSSAAVAIYMTDAPIVQFSLLISKVPALN